MRAKKSMKASFVVTISTAAAATSLVACGGKLDAPDVSDHPVNPPAQPRPPEPWTGPVNPPSLGHVAQCPAAEPREGTACEGPGLECDYADRCDARLAMALSRRHYKCADNWTVTSDRYVAACPVAPPNPGDSCEACAGFYPAECTYSKPESPCPGPRAWCDPDSRKWVVAVTSCNPPAADDAGAGGGM
jgi:hypothetical protein